MMGPQIMTYRASSWLSARQSATRSVLLDIRLDVVFHSHQVLKRCTFLARARRVPTSGALLKAIKTFPFRSNIFSAQNAHAESRQIGARVKNTTRSKCRG